MQALVSIRHSAGVKGGVGQKWCNEKRHFTELEWLVSKFDKLNLIKERKNIVNEFWI